LQLTEVRDHQILVLNEKGGEESFAYNNHSDLGKAMHKDFLAGKALVVTVVRAPVVKDNVTGSDAAFSSYHVRV